MVADLAGDDLILCQITTQARRTGHFRAGSNSNCRRVRWKQTSKCPKKFIWPSAAAGGRRGSRRKQGGRRRSARCGLEPAMRGLPAGRGFRSASHTLCAQPRPRQDGHPARRGARSPWHRSRAVPAPESVRRSGTGEPVAAWASTTRRRRRRSWTGRGTGREWLLGWGLVLEKRFESGGSRMRVAGRPNRVFRARRQGVLALRQIGREKLDRTKVVGGEIVERGDQFSELHGSKFGLLPMIGQTSFCLILNYAVQTRA